MYVDWMAECYSSFSHADASAVQRATCTCKGWYLQFDEHGSGWILKSDRPFPENYSNTEPHNKPCTLFIEHFCVIFCGGSRVWTSGTNECEGQWIDEKL